LIGSHFVKSDAHPDFDRSSEFSASVSVSCLELPVQSGDEEADELVVRVRRAVRHERLQKVVDVVVAP
jgi:hypothetical protein